METKSGVASFEELKDGLLAKAMELSTATNSEITLSIFNEKLNQLLEYHSTEDTSSKIQKFGKAGLPPSKKFTNKDYTKFAKTAKKESSKIIKLLGLACRAIVFASITLICLLVALFIYFENTDSLVRIDPVPIDYHPSHKFKLEDHMPYKTIELADGYSVQRFQNDTYAPESYLFDDESKTVYASMRDGSVRRLHGFVANDTEGGFGTYQYEVVTRTSWINPEQKKACEEHPSLPNCGVPLGMRFTKQGKSLLVCDAYFGLLEVDLEEQARTKAPVAPKVLVNSYEGKPFKFTNNLVQASNGLIYFTDSSTRWNVHQYHLELLENQSTGRLFQFNPTTKDLKLIMDKLQFPNGVVLDQQEATLYVAETTKHRIRRFYLNKPHSSLPSNETSLFENDFLIQGFYCMPDNLQLTTTRLWVSCAGNTSPILRYVGEHFWLRRMLANVPYSIFTVLRPKLAVLVTLDPVSGKLLEVIRDSKVRFHSASGAYLSAMDEQIYVGSFYNRYVARFKVPESLKEEPKLVLGFHK